MCFKSFGDTNNVGHDTALSLCANDGGFIAMPKDVATHDVIYTEMGRYGYWIGLTDEAEEGVWVWDDGEPLDASYSPWANGEPNNSGQPGPENCVILQGGNWLDAKCSTTTQRLVCQVKLGQYRVTPT